MCLMVAVPAFVDNSAETAERSVVIFSYSLDYLYGIQYQMRAHLSNPYEDSIIATLALYDISYNYITSVSTTSSNVSITLSKFVYLASGTYHLRLTYKVDGITHSYEKAYNL